ncbi:endonuclease domain-containing protein [Candidatus Uhrbacteria bacterium]|nr:MAG: endonuclease domain-containing protein [Candidatus Uhrbacteria bacterium]
MKYLYNDPELKERRRELRKQMTPVEHLLWSKLRGRRFLGLKFNRQFSVECFILDFYCPELRIGVELDGFQHLSEQGTAHDAERKTILNEHHIFTIRFMNHELSNLDGVLNKLRSFCLNRLPLEHKGDRGGLGIAFFHLFRYKRRGSSTDTTGVHAGER